MAQEVRLPREGSTTMSSGVVLGWSVSVGDEVEAGQVIAEIDTDKVAFELVAPTSGTVLELVAGDGEEVEVGGLLAIIGSADETGPRRRSTQPDEAPAPPAAVAHADPVSTASAPVPDVTTGDGRVPAAPAARRRARELDIPIARVSGSGPGGRIMVADVERAVTRSEAKTFSDPLDGLRGHRRIVAQRMMQAVHETAQVTLTMSADVSSLRSAGAFLAGSLADIVAHTTAAVASEMPEVNSSLTADGIVEHEQVNLGYAVDGKRGLVVPVVHDAARLDLASFAGERRRLVAAALDGSLTAADLDGGTLTVTNLGPFGVETFTPILTPGQCIVLGVGAVRAVIERRGGRLVDVERLSLSLTFDHRLVDGAGAARFLQRVVCRLEGTAPC